MDEMTLKLSSSITEEQFDAITDVDFDNTDRIWFHTKHGKDVEFVKRKKGEWTKDCACEFCGFKPWYERDIHTLSFCPNCGEDMRKGV